MKYRILTVITVIVLILTSLQLNAAPSSFNQAKVMAQAIYAPQSNSFYCNCPIQWQGKKGIPDLAACGYQVRKNTNRANRIEWEHVMPAHHFGHQRQCWQNGGRKNCIKNDAVFKSMEADLYNLKPAIGEVNGDRSNYQFTMLPSTSVQHGACPVKIDFKQRSIEPAAVIRGDIARIYFYMADKYALTLSRQQQQLFMAWHNQDPVDANERELNQQLAIAMDHDNPFVSGLREWHLGYQPRGYGLPAAER